MRLINRKKVVVIALMMAVTFGSIAFTSPSADHPPFKNLKVYPKDIKYDSLDHLMDYYKVALNVKCRYCHAGSQANPKKLDMASDANPIKDVTRKMILMTNEMNEKYIHTINHPATDSTAVQVVTCNTCHRGKAKPEDVVVK